MPQKKKTAHKKNHKKKHINNNKQNIIIQSLPNYSSDQFSGHQYNKNKVAFAPPQQSESRTDNLVGDLVGRLISKIETDGNKQTQEFSREIQPVNNNNANNVNIYNSVPGTTSTDETPAKSTESAESIADAVSNGIKRSARSAGEDFGIQTAASTASLLGVGALGVAYNSNAAANASAKAKLKLKSVGGGILGAVTSVGTAINNNILKRGTKLGGDKTTTNLIKEEGKQYEKKGKAGTYARLEDEINPLQADFDKHINQPSTTKQTTTPKLKPLPRKQSIEPKPSPQKQSIEPKPSPQKPADTPTPTPRKIPTDTPTPVPRINLFSPARNIANFKPQNILSPATTTISLTPKPKYIEPIDTTVKKMNAGDRIKAYIKRNSTQRDLKEVNKEASKIQRAFRNTKTMKLINTKAFSAKKNGIEVSQRPMPARLSGVHTRTRQGAITRTFEQNQAIEQLIQQKPKRQSSGTEISNATTTAPQATGKGSVLKNLKPLPESEKRGRGRPLGSGAPKPMRIEYDKPGRPKSIPDPGQAAKKK